MVLVPDNEMGFWIGENTAESISLFPGQLDGYPLGALTLGGNDTVQGSSDSELVIGNQGNDQLFGGAGDETLFGGKDNDLLNGEADTDVLFGNLGNDTVQGGDGDDSLFGGRDNDVLFGDAGNDTIYGDLGADTLTGGNGSDVFSVRNDSQGPDVITDFQDGADLILVPDFVNSVDIGTNSLNQTVVTVTATGEVLTVLEGIQPDQMSGADFAQAITVNPSDETNPETQVLNLTNAFRAENGLPPLSLNPQLAIAAETHSNNMAQQDFFSHTGADGSSAGDRAQDAGYSSSFVGENIAAGYSTPEAVVQGWIDSQGHRENLLNPDYEEIGIGYVLLDNDTGTVNYNHYWTQVFGAS